MRSKNWRVIKWQTHGSCLIYFSLFISRFFLNIWSDMPPKQHKKRSRLPNSSLQPHQPSRWQGARQEKEAYRTTCGRRAETAKTTALVRRGIDEKTNWPLPWRGAISHRLSGRSRGNFIPRELLTARHNRHWLLVRMFKLTFGCLVFVFTCLSARILGTP